VAASFVRPAQAAAAGSAAARLLDSHASIAVCAALALAAAFLLARLAGDLRALMRIKAQARVVASSERQARGASVACSADVRTPTAIGYFHPRIVVPLELADAVSDAEWRAIVAHENAHLARYDDWSKAIQSALVRALWFSPALWILATRLDLERELASDERAAEAVDARAYAACLVRLAADVRPSIAPAAWTARSQVAIRVERLLRPQPPAARIAAAARLLGLGGTIALTAAAALVLVPSDRPAASPKAAGRVAVAAPAPAPAVRRPSAPPDLIGTVTARRLVPPARPALAARAVPARPARPSARPVDGAEIASVVAGGPCRTCAMLRRPVQDGPISPPAKPVRPPARRAASAAPEPLPPPVPARASASFLPSVEPEESGQASPIGPFDLMPLGR
jgi:beta-lactamase regulating signal transducer with metallopeptidase domain